MTNYDLRKYLYNKFNKIAPNLSYLFVNPNMIPYATMEEINSWYMECKEHSDKLQSELNEFNELINDATSLIRYLRMI